LRARHHRVKYPEEDSRIEKKCHLFLLLNWWGFNRKVSSNPSNLIASEHRKLMNVMRGDGIIKRKSGLMAQRKLQGLKLRNLGVEKKTKVQRLKIIF